MVWGTSFFGFLSYFKKHFEQQFPKMNSFLEWFNWSVWAERIEPFNFSLYSVIFHRTIIFFLLGYSNCVLSRECWKTSLTQKKPAIQRILHTPFEQIPCIAGFLDTNNKGIDRSIVSMLRSMFGGDDKS